MPQSKEKSWSTCKHTEYTAYITWKTTCHFSTTLKVNSANLSKYEHLWINPTHFECWQKVYIQFTATAFHQNVTPGKSKYSIFFISLFFSNLHIKSFPFYTLKKLPAFATLLSTEREGSFFDSTLVLMHDCG